MIDRTEVARLVGEEIDLREPFRIGHICVHKARIGWCISTGRHSLAPTTHYIRKFTKRGTVRYVVREFFQGS